MKSYRLTRFGSVDALTETEEDVPQPGPHQVLIRVHACSLNYRDVAILKGTSTLDPEQNLIPLSDGMGCVVATGPEVTLFREGDRVAGCFFPWWQGGEPTSEALRGAYGARQDGWLTDYKCVDESALVKVPDYLSDAEAATLPCAAVTAWNSLFGSRPLLPGDTVLTQGTGGVALFAVQFAHLAGLRVISLTSGEQKAQLLRSLGAGEVLNYREEPQWGKAVKALTAGRGVQRIVEIGGPGTFAQSLTACAAGGEIALLGFVAQQTEPLDFMQVFRSGAILRPFSVGSRADFIRMNQALEMHRVKPVVDRIFSFSEVHSAWRYVEQAKHVGKVAIGLL